MVSYIVVDVMLKSYFHLQIEELERVKRNHQAELDELISSTDATGLCFVLKLVFSSVRIEMNAEHDLCLEG